jgi:hypothetical protein
VNAIPSGSPTASTGSRGGSEARREVAAVAVPSLSLSRATGRSGEPLGQSGNLSGSNVGTRRAKMVRRGALATRRAAQGRVGDPDTPRHIARHLVPHRLLSANTSATADAVRPCLPVEASPRSVRLVTGLVHASRRAVQPGSRHLPCLRASDTELVNPRYDVISTSPCELSRGKGVQAA